MMNSGSIQSINDPMSTTSTIQTEEELKVGPSTPSNFAKGNQKASVLGSDRFRRMSRAVSMSIELSTKHHKQDEPVDQCCGMKCSPEIKTLVITMTLFGTITAAQTAAAFMANSLALLGDCASMFVDTLSYAANIMGECIETEEHRKIRNQLVASGLSLCVLLAITIWVSVEALTRLINPADDDDDDVNAYIVFGFALGGLLFDLASFCAFYMNHREDRNETEELNMNSALLHVFSDSLRSTTTLLESLLIWIWNFNGADTDAWASLIVSGLILIGASGAIISWIREVTEYMYMPKVGKQSLLNKGLLDGNDAENVVTY